MFARHTPQKVLVLRPRRAYIPNLFHNQVWNRQSQPVTSHKVAYSPDDGFIVFFASSHDGATSFHCTHERPDNDVLMHPFEERSRALSANQLKMVCRRRSPVKSRPDVEGDPR